MVLVHSKSCLIDIEVQQIELEGWKPILILSFRYFAPAMMALLMDYGCSSPSLTLPRGVLDILLTFPATALTLRMPATYNHQHTTHHKGVRRQLEGRLVEGKLRGSKTFRLFDFPPCENDTPSLLLNLRGHSQQTRTPTYFILHDANKHRFHPQG